MAERKEMIDQAQVYTERSETRRGVKVIVLRTAGTNCDQETGFAFKSFGASVDFVHVNRLFNREVLLENYHILAVPGGFSYGDDIAAGRILGNELRIRLGDDLKKFVSDGKLVIGICNGFQILVKAGILPGITDFPAGEYNQGATLMINDSGKFEDRWIHLESDGKSVWTKGIERMYLPVAHAEGKFVPKDDATLKKLKQNGQVIFRYCHPQGEEMRYPYNPNGSVENIAGVTDPTGRIFGLMPHPERHFLFTQHPFWTRLEKRSRFGDGAKIFENGVNYVKENLFK